MKVVSIIIGSVLLAALAACNSGEHGVKIDMHALTADGVGKKIGTITVSETAYGTLFKPGLNGLSPGLHGFHLHTNGSCEAGEKDGKVIPGLAAGGHYDPANTGAHKGPYGKGHLGDLPALYADSEGRVDHPVLAPRLKLQDLAGHALMIHAGSDNYSDRPLKLGGGGARVACGVVTK